MDKIFTSYHVEERSFVSYIKRQIHHEAIQGSFSEKQIGEIDIIVSELCSNLIKHAGSGELLYRVTKLNGKDWSFEIISIDKGPGMSDMPRMLKDGVSTTNTLGQGLGAIKRLSTLAQLYSIPAWGTIHYAMVSTAKEAHERNYEYDIAIRALCVSKPRELVSGDGYRVKKDSSGIYIFFGDGLGHGEHAKEAVDNGGDFFLECKENDPVEILRQMHERVRRTRGLVASIAVLDFKTKEWRICGIGNILTRVYFGIQHKNYMSYNGTVGLNIPTSMKASVFEAEKNQHLVMCSDGIRTRWDINKYPSILKYDNAVLAAALYKDFSRGNDDSSILIGKVI